MILGLVFFVMRKILQVEIGAIFTIEDHSSLLNGVLALYFSAFNFKKDTDIEVREHA